MTGDDTSGRVRPRLVIFNNQGLASIGGGVTILRHLVAEFAPDYEVTVWSFDAPGPAPPGVHQRRLEKISVQNWRLAPLERSRYLAHAVPVSEVSQADLVIALDCHFLALLQRAIPRRLIYLSLSCIPRQEWFGGTGLGACLAFVQYAWLERGIARAAQAVIVSSARHASEMRWFEFLPRFKPIVMHPVFAAESESPNADRSGLAPVTLVAVGRLVPVKNFVALIELMACLGDLDCRLIIAGDGPELERLEARAQALGVSDRVEFAGPLAKCDALLARADLFLHPSRYESFGIAVFEAMRSGVVPVCETHAIAGYREITEDGTNAIYVDYETPSRAALAIRSHLADRARHKIMGEAARTAALRLLAPGYARDFRQVVERSLQSAVV